VTFPATVKTAVFLPQAIARAITNKTLGPGAKMITIAATMYSGSRDGMTIGASYGAEIEASGWHKRAGRELIA
jgi:hypothetical protein